MEKFVIYKNKPETFNCHFEVEGVKTDDVEVRLCLEFEDNKNLYFNGTISDDGQCAIKIPSLSEIPEKTGKMVVEAVADSVYFKLYECEVSVKNSVEIKMAQPSFVSTKTVQEKKINISEVKKAANPTSENIVSKPLSEKPHNPKSFIDYLKKRK